MVIVSVLQSKLCVLQPVPTETGLSTWLRASLLPEDVSLCPSPPWTADSVTQLLELVVKQGYFFALAHAFSIYQPVSLFNFKPPKHLLFRYTILIVTI